jgi:hypothetical protein
VTDIYRRLLIFLYKHLIRTYPQGFRDSYGQELVQLFRDQLDDAIREQRVFRLCIRTLLDWAATVTEQRGGVVVALLIAVLAIAATKHPAVDIPAGLSLAWPYSLAAGLAYRVLLDACVALTVLLAARAPRNIGMALLLVTAGRVTYFLLSATISHLPVEGPAYTARYMLQWAPLIAATCISAGRARNNVVAVR